MCQPPQNKRIDKCMRELIESLNKKGIKTLACCCGHGKYPITVISKIKGKNYELMSKTLIPRKKRFYKRDKQGRFHIPEVVELNLRVR